MNKGGKITSGILMDPQRAMLSVLQAACFAEGSSLRHSAEETLQVCNRCTGDTVGSDQLADREGETISSL